MKIVRNILLVILAIFIVVAITVYVMGDNLYQEALGDSTIEEIIDDIRSDPNYVEYEDLPQNYINAVIAVEDHRFRDHGAMCTLLCTAYILASRREEDAMLTDFILKGVVQWTVR